MSNVIIYNKWRDGCTDGLWPCIEQITGQKIQSAYPGLYSDFFAAVETNNRSALVEIHNKFEAILKDLKLKHLASTGQQIRFIAPNSNEWEDFTMSGYGEEDAYYSKQWDFR